MHYKEGKNPLAQEYFYRESHSQGVKLLLLLHYNGNTSRQTWREGYGVDPGFNPDIIS